MDERLILEDFDLDDYQASATPPPPPPKPTTPPLKEINLKEATPHQLYTYFTRRFKEAHGYAYKLDPPLEMSTLKAYKQRWGDDAGPLIAILFDRFKGIVAGRQVTVTGLSRGAKWIQDILYAELQSQVRPAETKSIGNADDFIKRFKHLN